MKNILEIDSIQKYVNKNFSLSDIFIKCETGNIIGIVGRNGSGKSILMRIIFGIEKADYKFIRINNKINLKPYKTSSSIVYLPQHSFLPKTILIRNLIDIYVDIKDDFINDVIIEKIINKKIFEISSGELRYLELKLILNTTAKFVLLDEPFGSLAPILKEKIAELIKVQSLTKGIIITDHDFRNLSTITTQNYLMQAGSLKKITNNQQLAFFGYLPQDYLKI